MKPSFLSFAVLMLLFVSCHTATGPLSGHWATVAQLPESTYNEVFFLDYACGWIVGDSGRTMHSTDGGRNWQSVETGVDWYLRSVQFVDRSTGWVAGRSDSILRTTDEGTSWSVQPVVHDSLRRTLTLSIVDPLQGWVVSNRGEIFRTTDGGSTWLTQLSSGNRAFVAVHFIDRAHGWASSVSHTVMKTTDGGLSWESFETPQSSLPLMNTDMEFIDGRRGWITTTVAAGSSIQTSSPVLFSDDAGSTWRQQASLPSIFLTSVQAVYPQNIWVAGSGQIFYSPDGGATWTTQYQNKDDLIVSLSFTDIAHGWALEYGGKVLHYDM